MSVAYDLPLAVRIVREAVRDKSYRAFPLGQEAGHFLRFKRKRLTESSYRDYEACLEVEAACKKRNAVERSLVPA